MPTEAANSESKRIISSLAFLQSRPLDAVFFSVSRSHDSGLHAIRRKTNNKFITDSSR